MLKGEGGNYSKENIQGNIIELMMNSASGMAEAFALMSVEDVFSSDSKVWKLFKNENEDLIKSMIDDEGI